MNPNSTINKVLDLLSDGLPHSTAEIQGKAGGNGMSTSTTARIRELRKRGYNIPDAECRRVNGRNVYYYRLVEEGQMTMRF